MNRYLKESGQAFSEYTLIGACIVVPAIAALILLGGNVANLFDNMLGKPGTVAATDSSAGGQDGGGNISPQSLENVDAQLVLNDGSKLPLRSDYPSNLKQSLQTSGANGTTELLLTQMQALIDSDLAGNLTPDQVNLLKKLAEQGHRIAQAEKLIEGAVSQSLGSAAAYDAARVNFEGQDMLAQDLGNWIGFNPEQSREGSLTEAFRNLYNDAVAGGALEDPVMKEAITILVDQVANIANGVESTSYDMAHSKPVSTLGEFNQRVSESLTERDYHLGTDTQKTLNDLGASTVTQENSNEICGASGSSACIRKSENGNGNGDNG